MNVNGTRSRSSTFLLDGGFNNDMWRNSGSSSPNPDAVQEFRLITSNFNAEFGRSPGAVFNVVLKSGTNELHGSVWEFLRNDKLNARNFFQPTVSPLRQNQYGVRRGRPGDSQQDVRLRLVPGFARPQPDLRQYATPPTAAERHGDFSAAPAAQLPNDPLTGRPFPGSADSRQPHRPGRQERSSQSSFRSPTGPMDGWKRREAAGTTKISTW